MGLFGNLLSRIGAGAKEAFHTYQGPNPGIFQSNRVSLAAFDVYYKTATPFKAGNRLIKGEGSDHISVTVNISDLMSNPLMLGMGKERNEYSIGLYAVEKNGRKALVVADIGRAIGKDMPVPDLYVIEEGKYLNVGRSGQMDLKITSPHVYETVSGQHLSVIYPEGSDQVYIVDHSRNGTQFDFLRDSPITQKYGRMHFPLAITPSMI